jgi:hypothetical protein
MGSNMSKLHMRVQCGFNAKCYLDRVAGNHYADGQIVVKVPVNKIRLSCSNHPSEFITALREEQRIGWWHNVKSIVLPMQIDALVWSLH